jgi:hypothetical protein
MQQTLSFATLQAPPDHRSFVASSGEINDKKIKSAKIPIGGKIRKSGTASLSSTMQLKMAL